MLTAFKSDPAGAQRAAISRRNSGSADYQPRWTLPYLTGGTIGTAGGTLTWANIFNAQAIMRTNKIYTLAVVLHPMHWYHLPAPVRRAHPDAEEEIKNRFMSGFYQASLDNMDFFGCEYAAGTAKFPRCSASLQLLSTSPAVHDQPAMGRIDGRRRVGAQRLDGLRVRNLPPDLWRAAQGHNLVGTITQWAGIGVNTDKRHAPPLSCP